MLVLYINTPKKQIAKIVQTSSGNDLAVITVNQYKENQSLSASTFSFDKTSTRITSLQNYNVNPSQKHRMRRR